MIKQLVVHVGDCKTGSTSIQTALVEEGWRSETGKTICYPAALNHIQLARTIGDPKAAKARNKGFAGLHEKFLASDADVGLISAEILEFTRPERLKAILDEKFPEFAGSLRVVCYVRPHCDRLVSGFSERIKQGGRYRDLEQMADTAAKSGLLRYADRMDRWREVFGDQYEVRPMVRSVLRNSDVVDDFLGWVLDGSEVTITAGAANESLCVEDLMYFRELHKAMKALGFDAEANRKGFGVNFAPLLSEHHKGKSTKLKIHKTLVARLQEEYAADAVRVDRDHIRQGTVMANELSRATDKALDEPMSLKLRDYCTPRQVGHIHATADLLVRIYKASGGGAKFNQLIVDPVRKARKAAV